jgi:nucleoside-diphosphate-sugar epimerase
VSVTVLVTGAAGRIGATLCERLPALGWNVRPFDLVPVGGAPAGEVTSARDLDAALDGVSEALGRYYADRYGLRVACLRIGTFAPRPPDRRALADWLSPGDCARLVDACLRSPQLDYAVVWGVSANARRGWSLDEALALGYRPEDDAEAYADDLGDACSYDSDGYVGGGFTSPGFGIDEVAARAR